MKILILCKRQYTNKDLLDDCYGRLFEIPLALSQMGHEVIGITASYRPKSALEPTSSTVKWQSINCLPFSPIGVWNHYHLIANTIDQFKPDLIWCSSDAWHIILTAIVATRKKIKFIADFYDNYESFLITKFPLIKLALRISTTKASGISCVSSTLANYLKKNYKIDKIPISIISNGINKDLFFPRPKIDSRETLKLPVNAKIIGTAGSLFRNRGIGVLFDAFDLLSKEMPDLHLLVAGPRDIEVPKHERIIDLGVISSTIIPFIYSSLDVCVVCNIDSEFGRYCHPQKFEEMIACRATIVAADVGELGLLLKTNTNSLYEGGNAIDLADKIKGKLSNNSIFNHPIQHWDDKAVLLHELIIATTKT